jgi:hypothetical protein
LRSQLLEEPQRASLRTLEACLKALAKARPRRTPRAAARRGAQPPVADARCRSAH